MCLRSDEKTRSQYVGMSSFFFVGDQSVKSFGSRSVEESVDGMSVMTAETSRKKQNAKLLCVDQGAKGDGSSVNRPIDRRMSLSRMPSWEAGLSSGKF